jgi:hypothetical protein
LSVRRKLAQYIFGVFAFREVSYSFEDIILLNTIIFNEAVVWSWTKVVDKPGRGRAFDSSLCEEEAGLPVR